jgi:hypothetical protein
MPEREQEYLGDGVYASWDGYVIWLRTGAHEGAYVTNTIALEPGVFAALVKYERRVGEAAERAEAEPAKEPG